MTTPEQPNPDQETPAPQAEQQSDEQTEEQAGTKLGDLVQEAQDQQEATSAPEAKPTADVSTEDSRPKPIGDSARSGGFHWGTGRRKTAVARVRIRPGTGQFLINKREINDYFTQERDRKMAVAAIEATGTQGQLDIFVNMNGGGYTGQAGAVLLGVSRALKKADPSLEKPLREHGYLTRDSRMKERKKPGQRGARRRFQFSKR